MTIKSSLGLILTPFVSAASSGNLLRSFVAKEIKGRFAGSFAGIAWTLLNPIATICVYMFLFSIIIRIPLSAEENGTDSFLIFFLAGLFLWLILADSIGRSLDCLIGNATLITKVVFPVDLLPTSALLSSLIINGIGLLLYLLFIWIQGYLAFSWIWLLLLIPGHIMFTWGLSLLLASLSVFIRDVKELMGIVLTVWFYGSPILYPLSFVPDRFRDILLLNPMTLLIQAYRQALISHEVNVAYVAGFCSVAAASYVLGAYFFNRTKHAFADVL